MRNRCFSLILSLALAPVLIGCGGTAEKAKNAPEGKVVPKTATSEAVDSTKREMIDPRPVLKGGAPKAPKK